MPIGSSEPRTFWPLPDPASVVLQEIERIPVSIVSGFLGSGKSTLINRWLRSPQAQGCAVIVNEFGEIGLDHLLVEHVSEDTVLLNNGCLCCAVRSDLVVTLRQLFERRERRELPRYTGVIIETSGLADCAPIMQSFMTDPLRLSAYALDAVCVAVDAQLGLDTLQRHASARRQVSLADELLVTKCDRVGHDEENAVVRALASYSSAPVHRAHQWRGFTNSGAAFNAPHRQLGEHTHAEHFHDGEQVCVSRWLVRPVDLIVLYRWARNFLDEFGDDILRIKGLVGVTSDHRPHAFHCVQHIMDQARPLERWPDAHGNGWLEIIASAAIETQARARLHELPVAGTHDTPVI